MYSILRLPRLQVVLRSTMITSLTLKLRLYSIPLGHTYRCPQPTSFLPNFESLSRAVQLKCCLSWLGIHKFGLYNFGQCSSCTGMDSGVGRDLLAIQLHTRSFLVPGKAGRFWVMSPQSLGTKTLVLIIQSRGRPGIHFSNLTSQASPGMSEFQKRTDPTRSAAEELPHGHDPSVIPCARSHEYSLQLQHVIKPPISRHDLAVTGALL